MHAENVIGVVGKQSTNRQRREVSTRQCEQLNNYVSAILRG